MKFPLPLNVLCHCQRIKFAVGTILDLKGVLKKTVKEISQREASHNCGTDIKLALIIV